MGTDSPRGGGARGGVNRAQDKEQVPGSLAFSAFSLNCGPYVVVSYS
jgi:hypothetical protein